VADLGALEGSAVTTVSVLLEGGGSGTWVGTVAAGETVSWNRYPPLESSVTSNPVSTQIVNLVMEATESSGRPPDLVLAALSVVTSAKSAADLASSIATNIASSARPSDSPYVMACNDILPLLSWQPSTASVAAICGTGTGFAARDTDGYIRRASGAEYILSDEGGGFDLGLSGLRAATRGRDGRGASTALTEAALALGGGTFEGLWTFVYGPGPGGLKQRVATFAPYVLRAAVVGDDVAEGILAAAVGHLTVGIQAVLGAIDPRRATLTMAGSVLCSPMNDTLRSHLLERLANEGIRFDTSVVALDARQHLIAMRKSVLTWSADLQGSLQLNRTLPAAIAR
jgi:N-acetylglucosamine kinase-like BadF-type ATPase